MRMPWNGPRQTLDAETERLLADVFGRARADVASDDDIHLGCRPAFGSTADWSRGIDEAFAGEFPGRWFASRAALVKWSAALLVTGAVGVMVGTSAARHAKGPGAFEMPMSQAMPAKESFAFSARRNRPIAQPPVCRSLPPKPPSRKLQPTSPRRSWRPLGAASARVVPPAAPRK